MRPWYQENEGRWLIFTRRGININAYPAILTYLQQFYEQLEPRPNDWSDKKTWNGRKPGPYEWYEIQDSIEYYAEFEKTMIIFPDIAKKPRFSWSDSGSYIGNTAYCIPTDSYLLLGILSSRTLWYEISQISHPFGERASATRYRLIRQYMKRLPIPSLSDELSDSIGNLAQQLTEVARRRYGLRRRTAHRIQQDLGTPLPKLSQRLELWWELPFNEFRQELVRVFKRDIAVKDRDDWEELLRTRSTEIQQLTNEIITLETELNRAVYTAFELNADEIALIERETKYDYGEW